MNDGSPTIPGVRKRKRRHNAVLLELGQKLNCATSPFGAGQIIVDAADVIFGWDACFIYLYSEAKDALYPVIVVDTIDGRATSVEPAYNGQPPSPLARQVIQSGAKLVLRDSDKAMPQSKPFGDKQRLSRSLLFVPIRNAQRVVGILSIQSYTPDAYTCEDLQTLQSLADHCGGALERIHATEALRESEQQFRTLAESSPVGIFKTDASGRCIYNNPRLLAISQISLPECVDERWANAVHPEDRDAVVARWHKAQAENGEWSDEHRILTHSGAVRWVRAVARPVLSDEGKSLGYVGCVEDITERKDAEHGLREAQAKLSLYAKELEAHVAERTGKLQQTVHSLESFCYTIAHDLRAPLRSVQGFAQALMEDYSAHLDAAGQDYCRRMIKSAGHMDNLIHDLLSYGQLAHKDLPLDTVSLAMAFEIVMTDLAEEIKAKGAMVSIRQPLPDVIANAVVLEQIVGNLLSNAMKFVPEGRAPQIEISACTKGQKVRLNVRDNGIGVEAAHRERIFRVFERLHPAAKFPGTGIGLAIVSKGMERMNGATGVESELNSGSTFWIELPAAQ